MPTAVAACSYSDQVALVTGAGSGIGRATALLLAARGARLLVNDSGMQGDGQSRAESVVREIRDAGGTAMAETTAVGTHEAGRRIAAAALGAYGRIDMLVNSAGIARPGPFGAGTDADIDEVLAVNLLGPYALMRAVWPQMQRQRYGRIVNLGSSAALGSGISGPYAASKGGLLSLTKDAGLAGLPLGICVNALMPCAYTPLLEHHPDPAFRQWMRRYMAPEKVAAVIAFLASRDMQQSAEVFAAGGGHVSRVAHLQSGGWLDTELTPEAVRDHYAEICEMGLLGATGAMREARAGHAAILLATQADHQDHYAELFPGAPFSRRSNNPGSLPLATPSR